VIVEIAHAYIGVNRRGGDGGTGRNGSLEPVPI
jgi:hypothetical protein